MDTAKAIQLLHRLSDEQFDGIHGDERREALEMAVRALEGDGDIIYRQDAIDACCFGITHARAINVETGAVVDLFAASNKELHKAIERIEALPSAQPTQTNADSTHENTLDCVSRQAAMVVFENSGLDDDSKDTAVRVLEQLPPAQPERKKGRWIEMGTNSDGTHNIKCSKCGEGYKTRGHAMSYNTKKRYNFCPSCGADMRGDEYD